MHWFDRMAKQFAEVPTQTTRRGVLRGTAVAAVVAPFAPGALAHANRVLRGSVAEEACARCLGEAAQNSKARIAKCVAENKSAARLLDKPKGGAGGGKGGKNGKSKQGKKAAEAAKELACLTTSAGIYILETSGCEKQDCRGSHSPTAPPIVKPGEEGGSACPSGTTKCSPTLCCYGGDNCCPCASVEGGLICCAAVIQCNCC